MFKTFYIKPSERGILYHRSDFKRILRPGTHRFLGWHWRVQAFDLNQPEAKLDNAELLLQNHSEQLRQHFNVVRTAHNEAALVRLGQRWISVAPNQLRLYWRGHIDVSVHGFNLDESIELPAEFVQQLKGQSVNGGAIVGLQRVELPESKVGLLFVQENFIRPLDSGEYIFWTFGHQVSVRSLNRNIPNPDFPVEDVLLDQHADFVEAYCDRIELTAQQVAIVRHRGKVIGILPPSTRKLFWQGVEVEVMNVETEPKFSPQLVSELVTGTSDALDQAHDHVYCVEIPSQSVGLLYVDSVLQEQLGAGIHAWWKYGRSLTTNIIDLKLQSLEVSGQEILSKDKVPLRLNLTADYRITDPVRATTALANVSNFLYKELQFGLRAAVGTKNLDALLEDKGAIDRSIAEYMAEKTAGYGLEVQSVGVKDIILPGEIKDILGKVVEAEKSAQANVVRRREETAATRSMLNTARVMEDNPIALRLKELEVLERIADRIDHINVNGSLDSILTELIRINP